MDNRIESLIKIRQINEKTVLVTFGGDAITAINTRKGIVVIDAGISTSLTSRYKTVIEDQFGNSNFALLINTHGHNDHCGGNGVFTGATVIAHRNAEEEMSQRYKNRDKTISRLQSIIESFDSVMSPLVKETEDWNREFADKMRYQSALEDVLNNVEIKAPDTTFYDTMSIDMGDVRFDLFYFGKCHSQSDIYIHVPKFKILFTGDLFFKGGRLSLRDTLMTDKDRWNEAVKWTEERIDNIETIITGHGEILTKNDLTAFNENMRYIINDE
ncbi:MBL fold metallo-hydrolase [candidate division WOR-3 bacterium]|nr:MBL fold metallo-hydrolase [candidate division WOR-3 bacterium]